MTRSLPKVRTDRGGGAVPMPPPPPFPNPPFPLPPLGLRSRRGVGLRLDLRLAVVDQEPRPLAADREPLHPRDAGADLTAGQLHHREGALRHVLGLDLVRLGPLDVRLRRRQLEDELRDGGVELRGGGAAPGDECDRRPTPATVRTGGPAAAGHAGLLAGGQVSDDHLAVAGAVDRQQDVGDVRAVAREGHVLRRGLPLVVVGVGEDLLGRRLGGGAVGGQHDQCEQAGRGGEPGAGQRGAHARPPDRWGAVGAWVRLSHRGRRNATSFPSFPARPGLTDPPGPVVRIMGISHCGRA